MRWLRYAGIALGVVALAIGALFLLAPYSDGPISLIPGGPFRGEVERGPEPDWVRELADLRTIEMQVNAESPRSILLGFVEYQGDLYVPATLQPERKRWPRDIEANPTVLVRVNGQIYERRAHKVEDAELFRALIARAAEKYDPDFFQPERTWFYQLTPPSS